jgi:esterase FrsA
MFTFPLDPRALFAERRRQFVGWGIPASRLARIEARVTDTWSEAAGGWAREWWNEAARAEAGHHWLLASLLYGAARFPVAATPLRREALQRQVACFVRASSSFRLDFARVMVRTPHGEPFPVHRYRPPGDGAHPVVCLSGGVDTGKMELHRIAQLLARIGRFEVIALDMPGTGETAMPLREDSDAVYRAVLAQCAGARRKALLGISFGGHWAAKLALRGDVDAAVDLGGPVGALDRDADDAGRLPNGMSGIVANAMRLPAVPDGAALADLLARFSLRRQGWLDGAHCRPLLAVNGGDDPYIPATDTRVFARYPGAEVWLLPGLGHCAAERITRVMPAIIAWLRLALHGDHPRERAVLAAAKWLLPPRERGPGVAA